MTDAVFYRHNSCNLRCKHCGVGDDLLRKRQPLELEETKSVLRNIQRSGVNTLTILGGEPFFDPILNDILSFAEEIGLGLALNTNLTYDADFVELCSYKSLKSLIVSVDGATSEIHDKIRGSGSFEKTIKNIEAYNLSRQRKDGALQRLEISFVLNGVNAQSALDIVKLCSELEADVLHFNPVHFTGFASRNAESLSREKEKRRIAIEAIILYKFTTKSKLNIALNIPPRIANYMGKKYGISDFPYNEACGGCSVYTYVDMHGNNLPCPAMAYEESRSPEMNRKIPEINLARGIIDAQSTSIFRDFEKKRISKELLAHMKPCSSCKFQSQCSPCVSDLYRGKSNGGVEVCSLFLDTDPLDVPF